MSLSLTLYTEDSHSTLSCAIGFPIKIHGTEKGVSNVEC